MAPSALDLLSARAEAPPSFVSGPFWIQIPATGKYIGRADIETQIYAPKPIIVRDTPYTWTVNPVKTTKKPIHYQLVAGKEAGRWTAQGKQVYAFVAPVKGQAKATDLLLQGVGGNSTVGFTYYIKQANESIAGDAKSGAWYVHKGADEFDPVLAGTKGKATAFRFLPEPVPIEGPGGIARSEKAAEEIKVDIV